MPRPPKCRRVAFSPGVTFFKPAGIPIHELEEIQLTMEEMESLRLKDLEGMEQEPAAEKMNVSRATFQRVLASARRKVADALLNGKAIRISGGNYELAISRYRCRHGHEWDLPPEAPSPNNAVLCPDCRTPGRKQEFTADFQCRGKRHAQDR